MQAGRTVQRVLKAQLDLDVSIGVGCRCKGIGSVKESYETARLALRIAAPRWSMFPAWTAKAIRCI